MILNPLLLLLPVAVLADDSACHCPVTPEQLEAEKNLSAKCSDTLKDVQTQLTALNSKYDTLQSEGSSCQRKLTESVEALDDAKAAAKKSQQALSESEAKLKESTSKLETSAESHKNDLRAAENLLKQERERTGGLESKVESLKADLEEATKGRQQMTQDLARLERELVNIKKEKEAFLSEKRQLESDRIQLQEDQHALESRIDMIESKIYSSYHFWLKYSQCKHIATAFLGVLRAKVQTLLGGIDVVEIVSLQFKVWWHRIVSDEHVVKAWDSTKTMMSPYIERAFDVLYHTNLWNIVLQRIDSILERWVTSLTSVDPSVSKLIPSDFNDRCYAFAFIFIVLGTAANLLIQYTWSIIKAPLALFGGKSTRKATKSRPVSKSMTVAKSAPKNEKVTAPLKTAGKPAKVGKGIVTRTTQDVA